MSSARVSRNPASSRVEAFETTCTTSSYVPVRRMQLPLESLLNGVKQTTNQRERILEFTSLVPQPSRKTLKRGARSTRSPQRTAGSVNAFACLDIMAMGGSACHVTRDIEILSKDFRYTLKDISDDASDA